MIYVLPYYKISMLVVIYILGGGPFVFKGIRGARRIFDQNKQYVHYPKTNHKIKIIYYLQCTKPSSTKATPALVNPHVN